MQSHNQLVILFAVAVVLGSVAWTGCNRGFYRRQADGEAYALTLEKQNDPRWNTVETSIQIPAQSRMFDPFSADHPPLPPDDPASNQLMECVDAKRGYAHWHANGDTCWVDNPEWRTYVPMNEEGVAVVDINDAVLLAFLHSPEYQQQKETLFLSALTVSLERFGFDTQAFATFNSFFRTQGRLRGSGRQNTLEIDPGLALEKMGATGTTLAVGLANSILWTFAGPDTQTATTILDFSLIQPLLFGGGRDRVLENLTQSERTLLANVRQLERFHRGFNLQVTVGRNPGIGPQLGGSFLGSPGRAGLGGGYLGLLQQQQSIRIAEFNVRGLQNALEQIREFFDRERINAIQVRQSENSLYQAQQQLLQAKNNYQTSLDNFKITLGLPPELELEIEDPLLDRFELIDDTNNARQAEIDNLRTEAGAVLIGIDDIARPLIVVIDPDQSILGMNWSNELADEILKVKPFIARAVSQADAIVEQDAERIRADFETLESKRSERLSNLSELRELIKQADEDITYQIDRTILDEEEVVSVEELKQELDTTLGKLATLKQTLGQITLLVDDLAENGDKLGQRDLQQKIKVELLTELPKALTDLSNNMIEASLVQAKARNDSISLPTVDLDWVKAYKIARCFRRDWMNARASLVDNWRQIEFRADDLESTLDLIFEGDLQNNTDNPFSLRGQTGQLRAGFQFDAPITRLAERNLYRRALISYQQSRRQYYQFEDEVSFNLRDILRQIQLNKFLFELNRRSIRAAVEQVELARLELERPVQSVPGGVGGGGGGGLGENTSRNLTDALNALQASQQSFLNVWVSYEALRRNLDFDMGTMQLSADGIWIDPQEIDDSIGDRAAAAFCVSCDLDECGYTRHLELYESELNSGGEQQSEPTPADDYEGDTSEDQLPAEQLDIPQPDPNGGSLPENGASVDLNVPVRSLPPTGPDAVH